MDKKNVVNMNQKAPDADEVRRKIMDNQRKMQEIVATKNQKISEANDARLGTEIFAIPEFSTRWKSIVKKAIMETMPTHHALKLQLFVNVVAVDPEKQDITLFQFGVLNNSLEYCTPNQLGLTREEYIDFMTNEVIPMMELWKVRVRAIRDEITQVVELELKEEMAAKMVGTNQSAKA
jgi:hypothetical protein